MIVYGDPKTVCTVGEAVAALRELGGRDLVVACGMLEQAVADFGGMTNDTFTNEKANPKDGIGRESFTEIAARAWLTGTDARLDLEFGLAAETTLSLKTPEGFAFYQLYPEQYAKAAELFFEAKGRGNYVVLGIRSIGTSLSAVVAEALRLKGAKVRRWTLRPRGDPFARVVELPGEVENGCDGYLVVDEGPGMSGSSFVATYNALRAIGVNARKIHFFPGHANPPGEAASEEIREVWEKVSKWHSPLEETAWNGCRNIFRFLKEREKKFEHGVVWEFVGYPLPWPFDCSGEAERCARRCAELSCGLPVIDTLDGWIAFPFVNATNAKITLAKLAEHIVAVADEPLRREDEIETEGRLRGMLRVNVQKHFGNEAMDGELEQWLGKLVIAPAEKSSGDGRMSPKNWVTDTNGRLWKLKTTGSKLSHHVAYRLPVIWDVAQVIVEWDFSREDEKEFCAELRGRGLQVEKKELAFFKMACAALELGKAVMFGGDERTTKRFERRLLRTMTDQFAS
jgi:hypothetical protein